MRRFLMHILPPRMHKIRHYGLLAPKGKVVRILICKKLTSTKVLPLEPVNKEDILREILGTNFDACPNCITGKLSGTSPPSKTAQIYSCVDHGEGATLPKTLKYERIFLKPNSKNLIDIQI